MNVLRPFLLAALVALTTAPAFAAFESIRCHPDNDLPQFPSILIAEGITAGQVIIVVSVDLDGKPDELLALGYSHERLARVTTETVKGWRFIPARVDGQPVRAQTELRFDFTVEGSVITSNISEHYLAHVTGRPFGTQAIRRPCPRGELDRLPARVAGEAPRYAKEAAKEGARGNVEVSFYIDEKGEVRMPAVRAGTHPYLTEIAVDAMKSWKFEPPTSRGRPVLVAAAQTFDFSGEK